MTQDNELVGIGFTFLTVAAVMFLAVSGAIDLTTLRWDLVRLGADLESLLGACAAALPL